MAMIDNIKESRIEKIREFEERGIDPYPSKSKRDTMTKEIVDDYENYQGKSVTVAGRIMLFRFFGKLAFLKLRDASGEIQLYLKKETLGEEFWKDLKLFDAGDFVDAKGTVCKTKTGEISVDIESLDILAKSIKPLPEKWAGLQDEDKRFRQRYLDFLVNPDAKEKMEKRAKLTRFLREFLWSKGFIEIENPSLEVNPAGAQALPFKTRINAYDMDLYLRICAGELWQKMSTIGGFEKVFEIARVYRNEGVDADHNPEFTMLEFYWAYATLEDNIKFHEELFSKMVKEVVGSYKFEYQGKILDMTPPYKIVDYNDLFVEKLGINLEEYDNLEKLKKDAIGKGVELDGALGWSTTIDQIFKQKIRPSLFEPVFVTNYPYILTPLAKKVEGSNGKYIQMFQFIIDSMEMCRTYGELNNPLEQRERFEEQQKSKEKGEDEENWAADFEFVDAMEYGMPPQSGSGLGLDRWVKVLTNAQSLRECIAYPIMKPEK